MGKTADYVVLDVDGAFVRGRERGSRPRWWLISRHAARDLTGGRPPRPGFEMDVGPGQVPGGGRRGMWVLVNVAGSFELHHKRL